MGNCCCNNKTKLKSCKCGSTDGTYNIVIPSKDFNWEVFDINLGATADPLTFIDNDFQVWYDRMTCDSTIRVSLSTNDTSVDKIFFGVPTVSEFTFRDVPADNSTFTLGDLYIRFTGVPAPGTVVTFYVDHEGCSRKRKQTGTAIVP